MYRSNYSMTADHWYELLTLLLRVHVMRIVVEQILRDSTDGITLISSSRG